MLWLIIIKNRRHEFVDIAVTIAIAQDFSQKTELFSKYLTGDTKWKIRKFAIIVFRDPSSDNPFAIASFIYVDLTYNNETEKLQNKLRKTEAVMNLEYDSYKKIIDYIMNI